MRETIAIILLLSVITPILTYFCAKLGTFGFLLGREAFREYQESHHQNLDK